MSKVDQKFHELCHKILNEGREYENKNRGVKRLQIPSYTFQHKFSDGFPALTNKALYWKGIVGELIWFLRGDNDVDYLNKNGIKIWNQDAYNWYKKEYASKIEEHPEIKHEEMLSFEDFSKRGHGTVGRNYSVQWRDYQGLNYDVDQIEALIEGMTKDIMSSRLKVNAWNPAEIFDTALPPCHSEFQVIGVPLVLNERVEFLFQYQERDLGEDEDFINLLFENFEKQGTTHLYDSEIDRLTNVLDNCTIPRFGFELHWNQRSVDTFLGLPFNIASYGLLAKILQEITGYPALSIEGTLKCVHFYDNQYEAVKELLSRDPNKHEACSLLMPSDLTLAQSDLDSTLDNLSIEDFILLNYTSDYPIKVDMLAPKE